MVFTVSSLKSDGLISDSNKLNGLEDFDIKVTAQVVRDLLLTLNNNDFQNNPTQFLAVKEAERGLRPGVKTRELRIPDDLTVQFIKSNMPYINKKLKHS